VKKKEKLDLHLNRAQVGTLYREKYRQQQIAKKQSGLIPVTYHAKVKLGLTNKIVSRLAPQVGGNLSPGQRRKRDQVADHDKYHHSAGILPRSFNALKEATKSGSQRLATGNRKHREELRQTFHSSMVVHPSELLTPSERMAVFHGTRKHQANTDRMNVNPEFNPNFPLKNPNTR